MPVVEANTNPAPDNAPATTISLPGGKQIAVGGSVASILAAGALFFYNAHTTAIEKISALDAKVTVLQASLQEMKSDGATQRAEVRAEIKEVRSEIKEVNQSVTALARTLKVSSASPRSGNGLPLDFTWAPGEDGEDMVAP